MQRSANMAAIASPTAQAAASASGAMKRAQLTPISAPSRLPPTMDQGWASGLAGTANSSTAEAPMGAASHSAAGPGPSSQALARPVTSTPTSAPSPERRRSRRSTGLAGPQAQQPEGKRGIHERAEPAACEAGRRTRQEVEEMERNKA
jgi:hypothetical protein